MLESEERSRLHATEEIVISSKYSGAERRRRERRAKADRRDVHRTDGKISRRSGKGRRKGERIGLFLKDVAKR